MASASVTISAGEMVLAAGPMVDPRTGLPLLSLYAAEQEEAVRADVGRDIDSEFDDQRTGCSTLSART